MTASEDTNRYIIKQLESLEERLAAHSVKLEDRLDQLVELMRIVTTLQERDHHQANNIARLEANIDTIVVSNSAAFKRLFDKMETLEKESHERIIADNQKHVDAAKVVASAKDEINEYKHKTWGFWKAIAVVFVVFQGMLGYVAANFMDDFAGQKRTQQELVSRVEKMSGEYGVLVMQVQQRHPEQPVYNQRSTKP